MTTRSFTQLSSLSLSVQILFYFIVGAPWVNITILQVSTGSNFTMLTIEVINADVCEIWPDSV